MINLWKKLDEVQNKDLKISSFISLSCKLLQFIRKSGWNSKNILLKIFFPFGSDHLFKLF